MLRFLLAAAIACSLSAPASGVVLQSASDALSYRNVVNSTSSAKKRSSASSSTVSRSTSASSQSASRSVQNKEVDLTSAVSANIVLGRGDTIAITVTEDSCCTWKVKYDVNNLLSLGNSVKNGERIFNFKQKYNEASTIFLDSVLKSDSSTTQNKAVYIRGE
ncbi:MAG: hypothetical protein IJ184_04095 [Alphaproteobacteria bacterium]|nr:hypothetical protein [Alphaproteobacteria bacterium]